MPTKKPLGLSTAGQKKALRTPHTPGAKRLDSVQSEISRALATKDSHVHFTGLGLRSIPYDLLNLVDATYIDLSNNSLTNIPDEIWGLPMLTEINLIGNPLAKIPRLGRHIVDLSTYFRCRHDVVMDNLTLVITPKTSEQDVDQLLSDSAQCCLVRKIVLGNWELTLGKEYSNPTPAIAKIIGNIRVFEGLRHLSLRGFDLPTPPDSIKLLRQLDFLSMDGLNMIEVPKWISSLRVRRLSLVSNKLTELPDTLKFLGQNLNTLDISWNEFDHIPKPIFKLRALRRLHARRNQVREIPAAILDLEGLETLDISINPIENPPSEISAYGLDAIRNYWRQRADVGVDFLCEAKLIILGEPGAGKTSLAKKIKDPTYQLASEETSTEGIDVIKYEFPAIINPNDSNPAINGQRSFQVSMWDFGGQEIYHATHQFFLTRRSLYILVCDDRKEDTDFSYWLNVVEMLSEASPVLIVQNEKQDRTRDIHLSTLRARFQNLRTALCTNLDSNRGLPEIVKRIQAELQALPHVGLALPATWKRVREVLERDDRDYIRLDEYLEICQEHGFRLHKDKLQLSSYLHDLGICLHFQDDPVLKNIVILKPSWGTDAVYRVLDDRTVIESFGKFSIAELDRIWNEEKYEHTRQELLQLMTKFQLCYALDDGKSFIAPQLLSSEQPVYFWNSSNNLSVKYAYKFLPKGIITRLIVSLHHLIVGGLVWKTGVILERNNTRAEVIEAYAASQIVVRVSGADGQGLLAIIDEQLQRLHRSFHGLVVDRYLPCQCLECQTSLTPYYFSLEKLLRMAAKDCAIQCHDSADMINAAELVRFIFPGLLKERGLLDISENIGVPGDIVDTPTEREIYVSYAWSDDSRAVVAQIQSAFQNVGLHLRRDQDEIGYKDSIRDFMNRLGQGKCVVVVITEEYLRSQNCMYEILEISRSHELRKRVFPLILPSARIFKAADRIRYVGYWEEEIAKLDSAIKGLRGDHLSSFHDELNLLSEIRRSFDSITSVLKDMNALSLNEHKESEFKTIIERISQQIAFD
jgi:internalin A